MHRKLPLLAITSALLVGCGSSDSGSGGSSTPAATAVTSSASTATTPVVTRASYIETADAFCKRINAESKRKNEQLVATVKAAPDDAGALSAIKGLLRSGYVSQRKQVEEFNRLDTPPEDAAVIEKLKEASDEQTALLGRIADAAEQGDLSRFTSLTTEQQSASTRYKGLAQGYGFRECGSGKSDAS